MSAISCFSSPKRLPGIKKEFPNVSARVKSLKERITGSNAAKLTDQPKQQTHHDSSAVSGCLKGFVSVPKSKILVRKPVETCRKAAPAMAAPKWNQTTRVDHKAEIKPLAGTKKTLADFVRKPFRAAPVPASTYKPTQICPAGKQSPPAKKDTVKTTAEPVLPFRAQPVPVSTYKQPRCLPVGNQSGQRVAEKDTAKQHVEAVPLFRAKPVPASTYKPFKPVIAKTR